MKCNYAAFPPRAFCQFIRIVELELFIRIVVTDNKWTGNALSSQHSQTWQNKQKNK